MTNIKEQHNLEAALDLSDTISPTFHPPGVINTREDSWTSNRSSLFSGPTKLEFTKYPAEWFTRADQFYVL